MAWADSKIFRQFLGDAFLNTAAFDLDSDTFKAALYNNSITPDNDVSAANSAYNAGQWATANEQFEAGQWAQGGVALASPVINVGTADVVFWDANDTASGSAADVANVYGCLVYDDTLTTPVADQGICYNYFGGSNSVTNGTFTIVWSANGIFRFTL
jgi:hypothetical protein